MVLHKSTVSKHFFNKCHLKEKSYIYVYFWNISKLLAGFGTKALLIFLCKRGCRGKAGAGLQRYIKEYAVKRKFLQLSLSR